MSSQCLEEHQTDTGLIASCGHLTAALHLFGRTGYQRPLELPGPDQLSTLLQTGAWLGIENFHLTRSCHHHLLRLHIAMVDHAPVVPVLHGSGRRPEQFTAAINGPGFA